MRKALDSELEGKINKFLKEYREAADKYKLVLEVNWDIREASNSLAPNCSLELAESRIDCYETTSHLREDYDGDFVGRLRNIVDMARDKYGEVMEAVK